MKRKYRKEKESQNHLLCELKRSTEIIDIIAGIQDFCTGGRKVIVIN